MRALLIDDEARSSIKRVVDYAENHPFSISALKKIMNGESNPPGNDPNYICKIQLGFKCVFTIDMASSKESDDTIWVRHLSVSVESSDPEEYPPIQAVSYLMSEFGFKEELKPDSNIEVYFEKEVSAVNILEVYN